MRIDAPYTDTLTATGAIEALSLSLSATGSMSDLLLSNGMQGSRIGLGTSPSATATLHTYASILGQTPIMERETSGSSSLLTAMRLKQKIAGQMSDGFGPGVSFYAEDEDGTSNVLGTIGYERSGADNSGRMVARTFNDGVVNDGLYIYPDGKVGVGKVPTSLLSVASGIDAVSLGLTATGSMDRLLVTNAAKISANDTSVELQLQNEGSTTDRYPHLFLTNYAGSQNSGHPFMSFANSKGTMASPSALQASGVVGNIAWYAHDGTELRTVGSIQVNTGANFAGADREGVMSLLVGDGTSITNGIKINPTGLVEIPSLNVGSYVKIFTDASSYLSSTTGGVISLQQGAAATGKDKSQMLVLVRDVISGGVQLAFVPVHTDTDAYSRVAVFPKGAPAAGAGFTLCGDATPNYYSNWYQSSTEAGIAVRTNTPLINMRYGHNTSDTVAFAFDLLNSQITYRGDVLAGRGAANEFHIGSASASDSLKVWGTIEGTTRLGIGAAPHATIPGYIYVASGDMLRLAHSTGTGFRGIDFFSTPGGDGNFSTAKIMARHGTSYVNSALSIQVADSSKALQDRLIIDVAGNVGIGTTSPTRRLDVRSSDVSETIIGLNTRITGNNFGVVGTSSGTGADINAGVFANAKNATANRGIWISSEVVAAADNYAIYSAAPAQSYFAGNVGIGTTAPAEKLSVDRGNTDGAVIGLVTADNKYKDLVWATSDGTVKGIIRYFDSTSGDASDQFRFGVGGTANLVAIDASGNIGIGLTSGINSKLTFVSDTVAAGGILFGSDTNLYRSAANTLKTDDSLTVDINLTVNGNTTLGDASTDTITATGRLIMRTLASDPQHATPASRPAGSVAEMAYYSGKMYICTNAATPTWEMITSA